jgi:hypothetical protein
LRDSFLRFAQLWCIITTSVLLVFAYSSFSQTLSYLV